MNREEIERGFVGAGWQIDGGFAPYLIVGNAGDLSILAHRWAWGTDDPVFELSDEETDLAFWVREIPTPERAAVLLGKHGGSPEEERGRV